LVKINNSSKKTDNKKIDNKKKDNKKIIVAVIACVIILTSVLFMTLVMNLETSTLSETSSTMSDYIENLSVTHTEKNQTTPYFHIYLTPDDTDRLQTNLAFADGLRLTLNELNAEQFISDLKPNDGTVVIFPVFTAAAYQMSGFYAYYADICDESCITDLSFEKFNFDVASSGGTAQILYHAGYDFLTDIEVDKNPKILENYDTVILLHNEYVTKKMFDAISNHPNLIFLFPNALYAEIDVNYDTNTMTLIRGHDYPPGISNGFDYEIEERFHEYEYDSKCENWEFIEIKNGYHLNCYPEHTHILENFEILKKMKDL
tara:strand:- start:166 stop:1116 length:951 start_codon:yes stop_codon:yes gene_type:complete